MQRNNSSFEGQLVNGKKLLEIIFEEGSRPSARWLETQKKARAFPIVRIGRLTFYSPDDVRQALARRNTVNAA